MNEVYEPPLTGAVELTKRNVFVAVIIGIVVDFGLSLLLAFGLAIGVHKSGGLSDGEDDPSNLVLEYLLLFIGLSCAFIGSFVACRFANQKEYIIAAVLSFIGVWWGYEYEGTNVTITMHYISLCVLVLLVFLPAYTNKRKNA